MKRKPFDLRAGLEQLAQQMHMSKRSYASVAQELAAIRYRLWAAKGGTKELGRGLAVVVWSISPEMDGHLQARADQLTAEIKRRKRVRAKLIASGRAGLPASTGSRRVRPRAKR